jgi:Ca2+/Na+ antiporter
MTLEHIIIIALLLLILVFVILTYKNQCKVDNFEDVPTRIETAKAKLLRKVSDVGETL